MNRTLKLSMLIALALGSSHAIALELGQVQIKSALGQPLLAEIPLHPASPAELKGLTVQLAPSGDFERAGIVGGRTTIPLNFSVANAGTAHPVIRITSSGPVDNPYIDLLLEVNGKAGKSVREVVILLDPPSSAPAPAAPVVAPVQAPATATRAAPAAAPAAKAESTGAASSAPEAGHTGGLAPVQRGQTLSTIAHKLAPAGVDLNQMLLALKQANPNAFYRDNINALKTGVVLRVPTTAEAQAMTAAAAMAEVRKQNGDWRAGSTVKPSMIADAATRAGVSSDSSAAATKSGDHLALVPPKDGGTGNEGNGVVRKNDKASAALNQDLLRAKESIVSLQQQSADLKVRLKDMTDINGKNEHLLSLKDDEIANLQKKLAEARKAANAPAATPAPMAKLPAAAATVAEAPAAVAPVASTPAPAPATSPAIAVAASAPAHASTAAATPPATAASIAAAAVASTTAKPAAKPVPAPAPAVEVVQPWYMQPWVWAAAGGVVILLLLLAMRGRKRHPVAAKSSASSLADRFATPGAAAAADDVDDEELLRQLAEHPDDIYLHLELVTLYYSRRDEERFEAAAEAMYAHVTDPQQDEWQDVVHMGEDLVPGHPLFSAAGGEQAHHEGGGAQTFDITDADADAPTVVSSMPATAAPQTPKKVSEYNFDFNLTSQRPSAAESDRTVVSSLMDDSHLDAIPDAPASDWSAAEPQSHAQPDDAMLGTGEFSDDPSDTKLDLARAYLDMGDAEGARAMLDEVMKEGTQLQRETAKRLIEGIH